MVSQTIISLAILKVNWDQNKSPLEPFVPIIAECIRLSKDDVVSVPALQKKIESQFGLRFPQNTIKMILRRMRKRQYVKKQDQIYVRDMGKLGKLNFHEVQQRIVRIHEALINELIAYVSSEHQVSWSDQDAVTALQSYFEESQLQVVNAATYGTVIPATRHTIKGARFLVCSFVEYLQETHSSSFEYLMTIAKGNMLANAIFLPNIERISANFHNTAIYFDTSFLIFALGYAGKARQNPCIELLDLLWETGARLRCYVHTLEEVKGVLAACAYIMGKQRLRDAYGPSIEYFLSKGYSASDIELFIVKLEKSLEALRVKVRDKPEHSREYMIDEDELSRVLDEEISYSNPTALQRDVDSISGIVRLRHKQDFFSIELCPALFVTSNPKLVRACQKFFSQESRDDAISSVVTDYTLTNLLWLKKPLKVPDLPRKRIIADCYAATQPSEHLWSSYLTEIDKLQQNEQLSEDDFNILRYSIEAKSVLMEKTLGEEEVFSAGTVPEILKVARSQIRSDLQVELESERRLREEAEEKAEAVKASQDLKETNVRLRSQKYAHMIVQGLKHCIGGLLLVGALTVFTQEFPSFLSPSTRYIISLIAIVAYILSVINVLYGMTINSRLRGFEKAISDLIHRKLITFVEP